MRAENSKKKIIDPDWINEIAEALLDININELSEKQKRMLRDLYLENLKNGLKPKESINNALQIVRCFKT
ncbi:hypothetical protein AYK24_08140 [Thermoplasmatales archaeon SG8-52-4]|nr:MAG: hypothetical protein AYK24_08140 [Thermoplasmatales archaeon SG8-52-4]